MGQFKDITGQFFGKLKAIKKMNSDHNGCVWLFLCECGIEKEIPLSRIKTGTVTCGCSKQKQLPPGVSTSIDFLYRNYIKSAKIRSIDFELNIYDFIALTSSNCHYSKHPPSSLIIRAQGNYAYNGIDRVDNDRGYTLDNCVPCCGQCNRAKKDMTYDEFIKWITTINHNFKGVI